MNLRPPWLIALAATAMVGHPGWSPGSPAQTRRDLPGFQLPPGFEIERVAGPPLVSHPTLVGFDDRGRLFVSENAGVNLDKAGLIAQTPSAIRLLEDTDGDGVFDKAGVFADRLTFPQGALWHEGALFAASPPSMWRFEDANNDGVADGRRAIATGFDFTGNAADIHGPFLAPTGRLFWCHGRKGHEVYDGGRLVSKALGARIWTSRLDGSDLQVFAGGGMDNPAEVAFTDEGDIFGTVNIFHDSPRADAIVHWVYGGVYPRADQEQALGEFKRTAELLAPAITLGHVAPAGLMRYRSRALGPEFQNNLFVAEFDTHRITRVILERQGSTFTGRTELFLSSSDPHRHFTDVLEDADGSLLVVDTGGWFSNGCSTSGGAKPDASGAIYRVRRKNGGQVSDPRGLTIDWAAASTRQLAALLNDARFAVRDRAIAELARRGDRAVPDLAAMASSRDRQARLGAVWTLTRIDTASARSAVLAAFRDADSGVRQAAARSAFTTRDVEAGPRLIQVLADANPAVRREAAAALGRLPPAAGAVPALLQALAAPGNDQMLDHALTYALIELADAPATAAGLAHQLPQVRRAALVALDQMTGSPLRPDQTFPLLTSPVASLRAAALNVITGRRQWVDAVVAELQRSLGAGRLAADLTPTVRTLLIKFGREIGVQELIGHTLTRADLPHDDRLLILTAAGDTPGVQIHASWRAPLQSALASGHRDLTSAAVTVIRAARSDGFDDDLRRVGADNHQDPLLRVAALQAIRGGAADSPGARGRGGPVPLDASTFDLAVSLFGSAPSVSVRAQAAQMLARASLTAPQLLRLADAIQTAGPLELQAVVPVLATSRDSQVGLAFLEALAKSPGLFALTEGDIRRSFRGYPADVAAASAPLVQQLLVRDRDKDAHLADLASVLDRGDIARGRRVFESTGHCVLCHRVGSTGAQVGPDLSTIGRIRTGPELLNAIAYPSDSIARGYEAYSVTLRDGRTVVGTVPRETTDTVQVTPASGPPLALARDQITSMTPVATSLMPPGLDALLSRQDLGDLIAYLRMLK